VHAITPRPGKKREEEASEEGTPEEHNNPGLLIRVHIIAPGREAGLKYREGRQKKSLRCYPTVVHREPSRICSRVLLAKRPILLKVHPPMIFPSGSGEFIQEKALPGPNGSS